MNPKARAKLDQLGYKSFDEYYKSPIWLEYRSKLVEYFKENNLWNCEACKCGGDRFDLHHIDYSNFACFDHLELRDIHVLCKKCHTDLHRIWKEKHRGLTLREATWYVLDGKLLQEQREKPRPPSFIKRISPPPNTYQRS